MARAGFGVDDIAITGLPTDGGETDPGWTYAGFIRTTGTVTQSFFNAYIAEYRQYVGYDKSLKTGPYNFGFLDNPNLQNWVEHFPYQDGLLVWYYDTSFPITTWATIAFPGAAVACSCRSMHIPICSSGLTTVKSGVHVSSLTTRPLASTRPTRFASMPTALSNAMAV